MHPLLPILDPSPANGQETTVYAAHPVREAAPTRSRGIPFVFSLGLTPLSIYGLCLCLHPIESMTTARSSLGQPRKSISLDIQETEASPSRPPVKNPVGPDAPGGEGHREGTNSIDPRLMAHTSIVSQPSDAIDPDELTLSPRATPVFLSLNPTLPLREGGNGLASGTGRDSAKGPGGLIREPKAYDFKLIPIKQVQAKSDIPPGQELAAKIPVIVRLLIGSDGVPFKVEVLSGPPFLHEVCLQAALEWRFEPLEPHGLKAPVPVNVEFYPFVRSNR